MKRDVIQYFTGEGAAKLGNLTGYKDLLQNTVRVHGKSSCYSEIYVYKHNILKYNSIME